MLIIKTKGGKDCIKIRAWNRKLKKSIKIESVWANNQATPNHPENKQIPERNHPHQSSGKQTNKLSNNKSPFPIIRFD